MTSQYHHLDDGLFSGCEHMVEGLLYSMGIRRDLLDDARQEAYLGILEAAGKYDPDRGASFLTFANAVARRSVIDWLRKMAGSRVRNLEFTSFDETFMGGCEFNGNNTVMIRELRDASSSLEGKRRELAGMMLEGLEWKEIGERLRISVPRIGQLRLDVLKELRKKMS